MPSGDWSTEHSISFGAGLNLQGAFCAWTGCGVPRLRARRRGRHSAGAVSCGPAAFELVTSLSAVSCLAATASWPAELAPLARPLSDARSARHPTPRPGAVPCGVSKAREDLVYPQRTARRTRCGVTRGARRRAAGVVFQKLRRAGTNTGRKARAGGAPRTHSESCRPAGCATHPVSPAARRAESRRPAARPARRGLRAKKRKPRAPTQRARCAGDSDRRHANRERQRSAVGAQGTNPLRRLHTKSMLRANAGARR